MPTWKHLVVAWTALPAVLIELTGAATAANPLMPGARTEIRYALDRPLCERLLAGEGDEDSVNLFQSARRFDTDALTLNRWEIDLLNTGSDDTTVYALVIEYNRYGTTHLFAFTAGDPFEDSWRNLLLNMPTSYSSALEPIVADFKRRAQWRFEADPRDDYGRLEFREIDGKFYVLTFPFDIRPELEIFAYRPTPLGSTLVCYFHHQRDDR